VIDANAFALRLTPIVTEIQARGVTRYTDIAAELNTLGHRTPTGLMFTDGTVSQLVERIKCLS
jgi:hypothetical protein